MMAEEKKVLKSKAKAKPKTSSKTEKKTTTRAKKTATTKSKTATKAPAKAKVSKTKKAPKKASFEAPSHFVATIDKAIIKDLPRAVCTGEVRLVDNKTKLRQALKELKGIEVLGIDTETRPSFEKRRQHSVCLLQIATGEVTYLFRLNKIGLASGLIKILADPNIIKVGLSLQDDCRVLRRLGDFEPKSFLELQRLCPGYGIKDASLQKIYAIVFGQYMSKSQRMSNWEAETLTTAQQEYAALDALACLQIYNKLLSLPNPNPILFAFIYD